MSYRYSYRVDCSQACPLSKFCDRPSGFAYYPEGQEHGAVDYLFVMEVYSLDAFAGMMSKEQTVKAFSFFEFSLLKQVLESLNISFGITYLVRGIPIDEASTRSWADYSKPNSRGWLKAVSFATYPQRKDAINKCYQFFLNDLGNLQPKTLVIMGNTVKETLFPEEHRPITKLYTETKTFNNIPVKFLASPQMVMRNPVYQDSWVAQVKYLITGQQEQKEKEVKPAVILMSIEEVRSFVDRLKACDGPVSIDIETDNLKKRYGNRIATLQFSMDDDTGYVIPYQHAETPFSPEELAEIKELLYDLFKNPSTITNWVGHNLKFECNIIRAIIGVPLLSAPIFDTMVGAFLVDENRGERVADFKFGIYTLKQLVYDYCNFDGYDKGVLAVRNDGNLSSLPLRTLADYGAVDVIVTYRLMNALIKEARRQNYLVQLYGLMYGLYSQMILMFSDIEYNGLPVNKDYLRMLISRSSPLLKEIESIQGGLRDKPEGMMANKMLLAKAFKGAGTVSPLAAPPWVFDFAKKGHPQVLFFDVLRLAPGKVGVSGVPSVDDEWQTTNDSNPFVKQFMEWSLYRKMYDSFAAKMYNRVSPSGSDEDCHTDSRIRADFNLTRVVTGRISCSNPNLQQIPRAENEAKKSIKNIFQAPPGTVMVQLDYKANEIRWVGILSGDDSLALALREGKKVMEEYRQNPSPELLTKCELYGDIHKQTAAMVFGKPIEEITKIERQAAKACLAKGTLTHTSRGFKKIEEVEIGELVWTGKEWTQVLDLYRPTSKIYTIKASRGWECGVSEDHEIMAYDRQTLESKFVYVKDLVPGRHFIPIHRKPVSFPDTDLAINVREDGTKCPIIMTEDVAWWLGYFVSDGAVEYDKYCFIQKKLFGTSSSAFISQFAEHCGCIFGTELKEVPRLVLLSPINTQAAFISGYMSGAGSSLSEAGVRSMEATSRSRLLPRQISVMLWNLGIVNSVVSKITYEAYHSVIIAGSDYDRHFDESRSTFLADHDKVNTSLIDDFFYAEVKEVVETDRVEEVYDLVLNSEHPYFVAANALMWDCSFGILFDSSIDSIAEKNQKTPEEVETWFTKFFTSFPKIAIWKAEMKEMAMARGYVEAPHGRRRRLPVFDLYRDSYGKYQQSSLPSEARGLASKALRVASNAPIQGIASDAGMIGASLFAKYIRDNDKQWQVVNAVHDSCLYLVPFAELDESLIVAEDQFTTKLQEFMTEVYGIEFKLPLEVEFEIGLKWGDLEKWNYNLEELEEIKCDMIAKTNEDIA